MAPTRNTTWLPKIWGFALAAANVIVIAGCGADAKPVTVPDTLANTQFDIGHQHKHLHGDPHQHDHDHEDGFEGVHEHDHVHGHRHPSTPHGGKLIHLRRTPYENRHRQQKPPSGSMQAVSIQHIELSFTEDLIRLCPLRRPASGEFEVLQTGFDVLSVWLAVDQKREKIDLQKDEETGVFSAFKSEAVRLAAQMESDTPGILLDKIAMDGITYEPTESTIVRMQDLDERVE